MSDLQNIEQPSWADVVSTPAERHKVMRNTYMLRPLAFCPPCWVHGWVWLQASPNLWVAV